MADASILADEARRSVKKATRNALGETLVELFEEGIPVVAVDADLSGSTTLGKLASHSDEAAKRFFNAGIAEQNMVDVAAGLASIGNVAFTGSFAMFGIGRAYDQIRNTVCYSNLNVKLTPTHSGISVGPDGGSHQMLEDIALTRPLPNMRILVPADYTSAKQMVRLAAEQHGPFYIRLGRENLPQVYSEAAEFEVGGSHVLREGADVAIIACGIEIDEALKAAGILAGEGISAEVIDAYSIKPLDEETILRSVRKCGCAVTAEEHSVFGGLGEAVSHLLAENAPAPVEMVGMRDKFGKSGSASELMRMFGLDASAIAEAAKKAVSRK